ncbi:faciogenital dysplasia protein [Anaeramoeba flamelloides]|uniref:Faciogenital dysplasia protein n=1 Tax=Anaeramoeba flamelloides TaxID=1746091 RepID=A0AAV7Z1L2_9EUKA|nr:faciogenital dysplasia protein [Anaeramoeba flamelloides]
MLIMPVQQLPRYVLFLEELTKKTPHNHEDFEQIKNALEIIKDVTTLVNEVKRQYCSHYLIGFLFLKSITQDKKGEIFFEFGKDSQETIHIACTNKSDSEELFEKKLILSPKNFKKMHRSKAKEKLTNQKKDWKIIIKIENFVGGGMWYRKGKEITYKKNNLNKKI